MKKRIPTKVTREEYVEHVYCNKCGEEITADRIDNSEGVEIKLTFPESFQNFHLCFKCLKWLMDQLNYPVEVTDRREG